LNLGKPFETFVLLSYFNCFCLIFLLQTAESQSIELWGLNNFDYNCMLNIVNIFVKNMYAFPLSYHPTHLLKFKFRFIFFKWDLLCKIDF